jgi:hypothetical protein
VVALVVVAGVVELPELCDVAVAVVRQVSSQAVGCPHHWLVPLKQSQSVLAGQVELQ